MNDTIKAIASSICLPNGDCVKCDVLTTATEIYTAHVKLLEEALAKAEADKAVMMDALDKLARLGNGDNYGSSYGNFIAQSALAKVREASCPKN